LFSGRIADDKYAEVGGFCCFECPRDLRCQPFMKTLVTFFPIMVLTASISLAGSVAAPYEIGTWRGFWPAAISYTFDDDLPNQYAVAVPMFNARGFKITLFAVPNWLPAGPGRLSKMPPCTGTKSPAIP
jgi:hypothetical protein